MDNVSLTNSNGKTWLANDAKEVLKPGKSCPLHYRYLPSVFLGKPTLDAETLYVVGGLYGNPFALKEVQRMAAEEAGPTTIVFNGDFNWFNVDDSDFLGINRSVLANVALRGNVETELATVDDSAGCGCAYPDSVSDDDVHRSNLIMAKLRETAHRFPELAMKLGELPMYATAQVGDVRIGIVHGDAHSLAGWQFDVSALDNPINREQIQTVFFESQLDGFACSHTCLPALRQFSDERNTRWIINNGAAGMPNFSDTQFGLLSRISIHAPRRSQSAYGIRSKDTFVDAVPIRYDYRNWREMFLANWPVGSAGHTSYWDRIACGPDYPIYRGVPEH